MKRTGQVTPKIMMRAQQMISVGYQKILTFERPGGGFDWWGRGKPLVWLTAYGVQQLTATARVHDIDRGVINRAYQFMKRKQDKDGSWGVIGSTHGETIARVKNPRLALTAYVVWSLAEAGLKGKSLSRGLAYLKKHRNDAKGNPYLLSLMANAFAFTEPKGAHLKDILKELEELKVDSGDVTYWNAGSSTASMARGGAANVETTAMILYAMLKVGHRPNTVNRGLSYLVSKRRGSGSFGSTQATILALKTLVAGEVRKNAGGEAHVAVLLNGKRVGQFGIHDDNRDVMQMVDLGPHAKPGQHQLRLEVKGKPNVMYQVVTRYYVPWSKKGPVAKPVIDIDVAYDRTTLAKDDTIMATATMRYNGQKPTYMVILDLGVPPGFALDPGDFAEMVAQKKIERFSTTSRQITLYIGDVNPGGTYTFTYQLKAKYPVKARTPKSVAYEYYSPKVKAESKPVLLEVKGKKKKK